MHTQTHLGDDLQLSRPDSLTGTCGHVVTLDPPLWLQDRLNHILTPTADTQPHLIVGGTPEQALLLQEVNHCDTGLEASLASELGALVVDQAVVIEDVDELQVVALTGLEIVGVVGRGDLCEKANILKRTSIPITWTIPRARGS